MVYSYNAQRSVLKRFYESTWGMYALTVILLIVAGLVSLHEMDNIVGGLAH